MVYQAFQLKFGIAVFALSMCAQATHAAPPYTEIKVENFPIEMRYLSESKKRSFSEVTRARISAWAEQNKKQSYFSDKLPTEGFITDKSLDTMILVSPNRRVNPEYLNRAYSHRGGKLIHVESAGDQIAIYMVGASDSEAVAALGFFRNANQAALGSKAGAGRVPASEVVSGSASSRSGSGGGAGDGGYGYALVDSFEMCAVGVKDGAEGVLVKPFTMAWGSLKSLSRNPSAWWDRSVKEMNEVVDTVKNFGDFASRKWADFKAKPAAEKSRFYCSFVGGPAALGAVSKIAKVNSAATGAASAGNAEVSASTRTGGAGSAETSASVRVSPKHSSGGAGSLIDQAAVSFMDDIAKGLSSGVESQIAAALNKIKDFKGYQFSEEFWSSAGTGNINRKMVEVTDQLHRLMKSGGLTESMKVQVAEAYVHYGRSASGGWTKGYIGRALADDLPSAVSNYAIPDAARRVLHEALNSQSAALGFGGPQPFVAGAVLKAKDTIGFLGKTNAELTWKQQSAAHSVQHYFGEHAQAVQRTLYATLESGRALPAQYVKEMASKASIDNRNGLTSLLQTAGFTKRLEGGRLVYTHPETKSQISMVPDESLMVGTRLRSYTPEEISVIRAAISQPNGRVSIATDAAR